MDGITTATSHFGIIDPQQGCNFIKFKKPVFANTIILLFALHSARLMPPFSGISSRRDQESLNYFAPQSCSHILYITHRLNHLKQPRHASAVLVQPQQTFSQGKRKKAAVPHVAIFQTQEQSDTELWNENVRLNKLN